MMLPAHSQWAALPEIVPAREVRRSWPLCGSCRVTEISRLDATAVWVRTTG
jgi:hypothetical protein